MYLRRRRQTLLWKLLLDEVIEGLAPFRSEPVAGLKAAIAEACAVSPELAAEETDRVLELGALEPHETRDGTRFAWRE